MAGAQNLIDVIYTDFMNIYFEDILCKNCTPANYKTPNDYFEVNLISLREELFNLYITLNPELLYEIPTLYPRAYLLILSFIIPNCGGAVAGGW